MFKSTQQRLFRPLSSLNHFKIHQPLPLNPRESRQLLNLLTTSFRQHLDREHGSLEQESDGKKSTQSAVISRRNNAQLRKRSQSQSQSDVLRPTDQHLHSILTNPLFTYGTIPSKKRSTSQSARDPMDIFDEACARGLMKLEYAKACLISKKRMITKSSSSSVLEGMKESGAGSRVLKWMSSNGLIKAEVFREERAFIAILIEYLVAEGHGDIVWMWTKNAFQRYAVKSGDSGRQAEADLAIHLLHNLVKAQAASSLTLDSAYQTVAKAQTYLERLECKPLPLLSVAGCWLSHQTCVASSAHLPASAAIYDLFISTIPSFTHRHEQHLAHLSAHHPTNPSATAALNYLRKVEGRVHMLPEKQSHWRDISIGLDTAKLLLEQKQYADAKWVMNFLQERYPKELGLRTHTRQEFELAKAEADNLEFLQSLNLT